MSIDSGQILFEKFEIIEVLKKDSNTGVYLANHIYLSKKIILKTLNTDNLSDETLLSRFQREAKILAKLDHPNLIKVLDFGTFKNFFYISFEYFESRNLREIIKAESLSNEEKRNLSIQLLEALGVAHKNGVIHRDIKPENVLVDDELHLKIADFGLAMVLNETGITNQSSIVGTPSYMSPEQIRGEKLTFKSDIFSAGILIYELYTGTNPFLGNDVGETINRILSFDESEFSGYENIPEDVANMLSVMLRRAPSNRASSVDEIFKHIDYEPELHEEKPEETVKAKRKGTVLYVSGTAIIAALIFTVWIFSSTNDHDISEPVSNNEDNNFVQPEDSIASVSDSLNGINSMAAVDSTAEEEEDVNNNPAKLFIECSPWADVFINNKRYGTTPLKEYIELKPGYYKVRLVHPDYPVYRKNISLAGDEIRSIEVNMNDLYGYLESNVYPWGDVFIDGDYKGTTPLREPLSLTPGKHFLNVENEQYGNSKQEIFITAKETLVVQIDFESLKNK